MAWKFAWGMALSPEGHFFGLGSSGLEPKEVLKITLNFVPDKVLKVEGDDFVRLQEEMDGVAADRFFEAPLFDRLVKRLK